MPQPVRTGSSSWTGRFCWALCSGPSAGKHPAKDDHSRVLVPVWPMQARLRRWGGKGAWASLHSQSWGAQGLTAPASTRGSPPPELSRSPNPSCQQIRGFPSPLCLALRGSSQLLPGTVTGRLNKAMRAPQHHHGEAFPRLSVVVNTSYSQI